MANEVHLEVLKQGALVWNEWKLKHAEVEHSILTKVDLSGADLHGVDLHRADLYGADLYGANLSDANLDSVILTMADLRKADLSNAHINNAVLANANLQGADLYEAFLGWANLKGANLRGARLSLAYLRGADLGNADLFEADLRSANLSEANLSEANLSRARLQGASLVGANLEKVTLTDCSVYGVSVWSVSGTPKDQTNIIITSEDEPVVVVDDIEVAQFIYLLIDNKKIRNVIDTVTSKAVLILGRFTDERKTVLDAIRNDLRRRNYVPILFDFDPPTSRDITETVTTLARMARFIIADITDPRSIPQELALIIPTLPSVPVQPLLHVTANEWSMFKTFRLYPWVLETYRYDDLEGLLLALADYVIGPAEAKAAELRGKIS